MNHIHNEPQFGENWFTYENLYSRFVKELSSGSKIVEVGCWKGKSVAYLAVEIINSEKDIKIDAIDTWLGSSEHQNETCVKENTLYDIFLQNISPVKSIVNPIRLSSIEAAKNYQDNSIDIVFIDASHQYEHVKEDINAWYPKVKSGGYIAGHDYPCYIGVSQAVHEIFKNDFESIGSELCWLHRKK